MNKLLIFIIVQFFVFHSDLHSQSLGYIEKIDTFKSVYQGYRIVKSKILYHGEQKINNSYIIEEYNKKFNLIERYYADSSRKMIGLYQSFYDNGNINEEYYTIWGRIIGLYTKYFDNKRIEIVGSYKDIKCYDDVIRSEKVSETLDSNGDYVTTVSVDINSQKEGIWLYFNDLGKMIKREEYDQTGNIIK